MPANLQDVTSDITINWVFFEKSHPPDVVTVHRTSIPHREGQDCQELFATRIQEKLSIQVEVSSISFWKPTQPLVVKTVVKHSWAGGVTALSDLCEEILLFDILTAALGDELHVAAIHLIVTADRQIDVNWVFLNQPQPYQSVHLVRVPRLLPLEDCYTLFAAEILKHHSAVVRSTIVFLKPTQPLLRSTVTSLEKQVKTTGDFGDHFDQVSLAEPLITSLGRKFDSNLVHVVVTARLAKTEVNWALYDQSHPQNFSHAILIPPLFTPPECVGLFASQIKVKFFLEVDEASIAFWTPTLPIPIEEIEPGWTANTNNLNNFKEMSARRPIASTIGKAIEDEVVHIIVTADRLVNVTWVFFRKDDPQPTTRQRIIDIPPSRSAGACRSLFADAIWDEFAAKVDGSSIKFWKPVSLVLAKTVRAHGWMESISEADFEELFQAIPFNDILFAALEFPARAIHLIVTADPPGYL